jgi:2-haloacid dehalogenase
MVATHVWDTIGAQSAGMLAVLLTRQGNAPLLIDGLPQPNIVARDVTDFTDKITVAWKPASRKIA